MVSVSEYFPLIGHSIPISLKDIKHPIKLKFIGYLQGRQGLYCGFDLLESNKGKNNGSVDEIDYFKTEFEMSGLFVPFYKVEKELDISLNSLTTNNNNNNNVDVNALIIENECLKKIVESQQVLTEEFSKLVSEIDPTISNWEIEMSKRQDEIKQLQFENELLKRNLEKQQVPIDENLDNFLETPFKITKNVAHMTPIALSKNHLYSSSKQDQVSFRKSSDDNL